MNCKKLRQNIDDFVDGYLHGIELEAAQLHLEQCQRCRELVSERRILLDQLAGLTTMENPRADFLQQVIQARSAKSQTANLLHYKWFTFGAVTSLAASLAIGIFVTFYIDNIAIPNAQNQLADTEFTIQPTLRHHTLMVSFNSKIALGDVTFSVTPPTSVDIEGYVGERVVMWIGRLTKGDNILKIPIIVNNNNPGELLVGIEHNQEKRQFTVVVDGTQIRQTAS